MMPTLLPAALLHSALLANIEPGIAVVGGLATIVTSIGGALFAIARKSSKVDQQGHSIDDHEARLRVMEKTSAETATNVRWIKQALINTMSRRDGGSE